MHPEPAGFTFNKMHFAPASPAEERVSQVPGHSVTVFTLQGSSHPIPQGVFPSRALHIRYVLLTWHRADALGPLFFPPAAVGSLSKHASVVEVFAFGITRQ